MTAWSALLKRGLDTAKEYLQRKFVLERDGSGPPNRVAIRALIDALPCPVKVFEVRLDRTAHTYLRDDVCPLIAYDLFRLGAFDVEPCGTVDGQDVAALRRVLIEHSVPSGLVEAFLQGLPHETWPLSVWDTGDNPTSLQFLFYDPQKDEAQFAADLAAHLQTAFEQMPPARASEFDFTPAYHLQPDPLRAAPDPRTPDPLIAAFVSLDERGVVSLTLDELQQRAASLLLIPPIPEHVRRVFDRARHLYVFAYAWYEFFTMAQHQASLAVESAVKHRYTLALGETVTLRTATGAEMSLTSPDYERIWRHWHEHKRRPLTVNGKPFPNTMRQLLDWLVEHKVLTLWERKVCAHLLDMRNMLSHPTFASIHPPGHALGTLHDAAVMINTLFHRRR